MKPGFWYALSALIMIGVAAALGAAASKLRPVRDAAGQPVIFEIAPGAGLREIAEDLKEQGLVRSADAVIAYAYIAGKSRTLRPGLYEVPPGLSGMELVRYLAKGEGREATVVIPEGSTVFDIDAALARSHVTKAGEFIAFALEEDLEGVLFPDTYRLYFGSTPKDVARVMQETFELKMEPVLKDVPNRETILILASILEKEVPEHEDRRIVAGLLLKRIDADMPLQVDASVCYAKRLSKIGESCYPVTVLDTKMEDEYNTYANLGWPPGPIGNPGISAVKAALSPVRSAYWYYLSDPETKKTIFSKDLEEHEANRSKYLLSR